MVALIRIWQVQLKITQTIGVLDIAQNNLTTKNLYLEIDIIVIIDLFPSERKL